MRISDWSSDVCSSDLKPLNHFLPGTPVLSSGTAGCNLACNFCQNHDISKSRELDRLQAEAQPEAIAATALRLEIGRAACKDRVCRTCRSRLSTYHHNNNSAA